MRVAGPFTVESLSPHRVLVSGDVKGELDETGVGYRYDGEVPERDFAALILDNLKTSGVQQSQKSDKIRVHLSHRLAGQLHLRRGQVHGGRKPSAGRVSSSGRSSALWPARTSWRRPERLGTAGMRLADRLRLQL